MLRKLLLLAMGFMVVLALIATVRAQKGPAPAEKAPSADNPFDDEPAAAARADAKQEADAKKPSADKPAFGDSPFDDEPVPAAKANAKQKAGTDDEAFPENPFSGPPPKALKPFGKTAVSMPKAAAGKPAAKKQLSAADSDRPLRSGEKAILEALEEKTTLNFVETPLPDVIDFLQDKYRIPVKLDLRALKDAGVDVSTPVTCSISGVPLRSALRLILDDLQLEWTIWSDVLWITTPVKAESDELQVVKFYDVSDLIVETRDMPYRGDALPSVGTCEPWSPPIGGVMGATAEMTGGARASGGTGVPGSNGMGGMGGGMFSVPPESNLPAASSSPGSASFRGVTNGPPVVGAAERGNGTERTSPVVARQVGAQTAPPLGLAYAAATSNQTGINSLMDVITSTVATKSWVDNGGTGTISRHGNLLCISQTFRIQCEVKALLAGLRATRREVPTVVVDLQWLWLDGAQCEQLQGGAKPSTAGQTRLSADASALDLLGHKAPGFRGRIVCANGQLVHLASGDRRSVIVSTIPVVGSGVGYSPVVQVPNTGVVVEVRPTVVPGGTTAIVDVQSIVTRWGKPQATVHVGAAWPSSQVSDGTAADKKVTVEPAGSGSCPVQLPNMPAQQLATTVRVPLGRPVVLGGMTFAPAESAGVEQATDNPTQLYLIATTSIAADVSP